MTFIGQRTILVVEPDAVAARSTAALLGGRHRVITVPTARAAREWLATASPDLVILELVLPDTDGLLLLSEIKARSDASLLVYTSRTGHRELLLSLRLGADDFLAKPADPAELEARVGALLRRMAKRAQGTGRLERGRPTREGAEHGQRLGDLVIDRDRSRVTAAGVPLHLTHTEYRLLSVFARRLAEPLSRDELSELVGGYEYIAGTRSLDMHVRRLRAKLRAAPGRVPAILSLRGYGYRLVDAPDRRQEDVGPRRISAA
jgi:DNA-binding response OmpR family regulator